MLCGIVALLLPTLHAADSRIWTSRKGSTIEAELLGIDGDSATLLAADSKQIKLKVEDLSLADRQFLVEYGNADPKILTAGEVGEPEKQVRIDSKTFKKLDDKKMKFGTNDEAVYDLMESEHFLIASAGRVRPQAIAETAERLWHGMAFQHMNFRRDWGDKRMLILLSEDRDAYKALGQWYLDFLASTGNDEAVKQLTELWDKVTSTGFNVSEEMAEEYGIFTKGQQFNLLDPKKFKKAMQPFQINTLSGALLEKQFGGVSSFGAEGFFAILNGHKYYKEMSLAGKSETQMAGLTGTAEDDFTSKKGFADGTSWSKSLKAAVKKGKVKVELVPMFNWQMEHLNPERLVLIYSFACYMESTPQRLNSFAAMVRRIESSNQIPAAIEIARLFGFDSVAALEADWEQFIKDGDFN